MSLGYRKLTQEEDDLRGLVLEGEYQALILNIVPKKSEKTNLNMAVLDLLINDMGRDRTLKSWVMLDGDMAWMYRHLAISCGLLDKYDDESLQLKDFLNKQPIIKIVIKDGVDQSGKPIKRNNVADYLPPRNDTSAPNFVDSDIAF